MTFWARDRREHANDPETSPHLRVTAIRLMVLGALLILDCSSSAAGGPVSLGKEQAPGAVAVAAQLSDVEPRYVSVSIAPAEGTLIAGESGTLNIEVRLKDTVILREGPLTWDLEGPPPVLWISSPPSSGVEFGEQPHPEKPGQQLLVKLAAPTDGSRVLRTRVHYSVGRRTKAGEHALWFDVSVPLVAPGGRKIEDLGVVRLPFRVDTHLRTKLLMLLVVGVVVFLFVVEWVRVDVVGILMMVLLPELGLLDSRYAFRGLSSNAVVAIIGVMIISYSLNRVGLVGRMIRPLRNLVGMSVTRLIVFFSSLIAAISSVMQNTGAAVLFLPAIRITAARKMRISLSRVLMPIGMAAILGGTLTMIGTSPLILLNDLLPSGMPKFGLLELTPIGLALVVGGIAYLSTVGRSLLAHLADDSEEASLPRPAEVAGLGFECYEEICGPYELYVPDGYQSGREPLDLTKCRRRYLVNVVAISTDHGGKQVAPAPSTVLRGGMALCAYGPEVAIKAFVRDHGLLLLDEPRVFKHDIFDPAVASTVEVVVSPRSRLIGRTIKDIRFRETFGISALALHQDGKTYYREMADRPLKSGDAIFVQGTWEQIHSLRGLHENFIIMSALETEFQQPARMKRALVCFLVTLGVMLGSSFYFQGRAYNPIPLSVCLMAGALGMIFTKVLTVGEAYRAVDWRTVFLLAGLIPLGLAIDQTGTAEWIAHGIVGGLGARMTPVLLLSVLACMSCGFTLVISNVGACTLLVPLGMSIAGKIGVDPRVAAIVVGLGVSNSFILPTHQVNALYMGPGSYRTKHYIKVGGPLSLIYIAILVAMTYFFYL